MRVDEFDFVLPEERIALRPAVPRDSARMLEVRPPGNFIDHTFRELPDLCAPGDILVFNDTRVRPVQLSGQRRRQDGSISISATLIESCGESDWWALVKPGRRIAVGDELVFASARTQSDVHLRGVVKEKAADGRVRLTFSPMERPFGDILSAVGAMPLPPYIASRRPVDAQDKTDYQTVFAAHSGAIAAPTAGLHFSDELLSELRGRGIQTTFVTLHVGIGTFQPVKAADTKDHHMYAEHGRISEGAASQINAAKAGGGRIIAVGTTSLRLLESAVLPNGEVAAFDAETDIFITPGYKFGAVDVLLTNFHLPRSTLFMLVSAFCGLETMKSAYAHAIARKYRFYSYGDACLLFPGPT